MITENQTHIPEGWILTNFGDKNLFEILGSGISFFENEKDYYSTSSIENDKLVAIEQVITYRNRPSRANMQPVSSSVWFAKMKNTLKVIQPNQFQIDNVIFSTGFCGIKANNIDCSFLMQVLKSENFNTKKDNLAEGTTQVAVNNQHVKNIEFLLPCSISEQQKIASILSKLDEAITQTEQLIGKYKKIKEGLMHDLLTRGIDEQGNIRSEETHKFKDSPLGRIPEEWEVVDITKYTKDTDNAIKPGPFGSSIKKEFYTKNGYKVYGQEQVIANNPFVGDYYIDKKRYNSLYNFRVESGDVLLSCVGTIGNVLIIPDNHEAGIINPRLIKFSIDTAKANVQFFAEYLKQTSINIQLINMANGGTMPVLNKSIILNLKFIYPSLNEQDRIQEKLDAISSRINLEIETLTKLQLQKSGLMHDLLTGKVRVSNREEQKEQTSNVNVVPLKAQAHNQHIEDAVLIGAIVNAFYSDKYTLGRKKVQKLLYLVRRHQEASVACFKKKAAGPYAHEVRYKGGEPIAVANKYVIARKDKLGTIFSKGEKIKEALEYIEKWEMLSDIDWLLTQFKYTKVDQLELIATIDMARCDLEKEGIPVSLSTIKHLIATNEEWKAKLKKDHFDDFSIQRGIDENYKLFGR